MTDTTTDDATTAPVLTELADGVLVLRINRPSRRNAMNNDALHAISAALDQVERDGIRAIIFRGEGGTFCAGSDLKEMNRGVEYRREHTTLGQQVWRRIEHSPAFTIALIEGYALGGGSELALACDVRLAHADSVLGFPEVTFGAVPSWGGTQRLPRYVGLGTAKRMLLTGERIPARELVHTGLVDGVYESVDELEAAARELAERVAAYPAGPFALVKELVLTSYDVTTPIGNFMEYLVDIASEAEGEHL
jgi:enoyl-CoA hydratase/carnithine racemase